MLAVILTEPMTLVTDYILSGVTGWLGWQLWAAREAQASRRLWALAFAALALAALAGGSHHGYSLLLPESVLAALWKVTVFSVGIASFGMLCGSAVAVTSERTRQLLLMLAGAKLALYSLWMADHDEYLFVIADTGGAMLGIAILHLWSWIRDREEPSRWIIGAIVVSVLAASVQAAGLAPHPHFNHNDLYHVIQITAMFLFYKGAKLLRDRSAAAP
jgi:hypothetical protein